MKDPNFQQCLDGVERLYRQFYTSQSGKTDDETLLFLADKHVDLNRPDFEKLLGELGDKQSHQKETDAIRAKARAKTSISGSGPVKPPPGECRDFDVCRDLALEAQERGDCKAAVSYADQALQVRGNLSGRKLEELKKECTR